jgi:hypothetical protein
MSEHDYAHCKVCDVVIDLDSDTFSTDNDGTYCKDHIDEAKPSLELGDLNGPEGNAYVMLGRAAKVAKEHGLDWDAINKDATSSDYEHLIEVLDEHFNTWYAR